MEAGFVLPSFFNSGDCFCIKALPCEAIRRIAVAKTAMRVSVLRIIKPPKVGLTCSQIREGIAVQPTYLLIYPIKIRVKRILFKYSSNSYNSYFEINNTL